MRHAPVPPGSRLPRLALALALAGVACAAPAVAQERPDERATMRVEYQVDQDLDPTVFLKQWGRKFGAIVVVDPQVQQGVRIKLLTNINQDLTWGTVKKILDFYDVVVVEDQVAPGAPWFIRAHHRRNIPQKEPPPWRFVQGDQVPNYDELVTAVFQVKHGAGNQIFATVRGLLTRDTNRIGNILYVQGPEVIIIVDLASKVRYYSRVIEALDVAGPRKEMEIFRINFAPVTELATLITSVLQTLGGGGQMGQPGQPAVVAPGQGGLGAGTTVMADPRTNQLIVAAFPIDLPLVRKVIAELDVRVAAPTGRFHVYKCKDAKAADLAERITELFTGQRPAGQAQGGQPRPAAGQPRPQVGAGGAATTLGEAGGVGEVETRIVADERTNSLLIQAEERAYREILAVLDQLDRKRRRVMIEAEVWEVSTPSDSLTLGFELAGVSTPADDSTRSSGITSFGLSDPDVRTDANGSISNIARVPRLNSGLVGVIFRDSYDKIPVIINALANFSEARLVTRPFTTTNDNTPSTFTIANRVPFVTQNVSQFGQQANVQFVDANSTLTIEPQINSDDNLTLKLNLEISSFSGSGSPDLPPPTNSRKYEGEVTVPNGRYVVFGGLEQETETISETKVPFLGDIPILGHLFKNWRRERSKTKVYIFVRPTIFAQDSFSTEARLGDYLRERIHVEAERSEWLPPVIPERFLHEAGYDLQDEALDLFGTGSGDPFRGGAATRDGE